MSESLILIIWAVAFVSIIFFFFWRGKKALDIFPDPKTVTFLYQEKAASGRSNDNIITKAGAASGVLHVMVTKDELWVKTGLFFAWVARIYKLIHKINRKQIVRVEQVGKRKVEVHFRDENENARSLTLKLQNPDKFIALLDS